MDYKKMGDVYYVRLDYDDEIISNLMKICEDQGIDSATFSGIGGCKTAEIQTFLADENRFETQTVEGMLELIHIAGNIIRKDDGEYIHHTHAMYSYLENGEHKVAAGHMKSTKVLYTAEIELRPVIGGRIRAKLDAELGANFWYFEQQ